MLRRRQWFCLLAGIAAAAAGCGRPETPTVPTVERPADPPPVWAVADADSADAASPGPAAFPAAAITLAEIDAAGLKAAIAAHQNVVLVDLWATWCIPLRERFPHVVA